MINAAAKKVIGVLARPEVGRICFTLGGTSINKSTSFQPVIGAIQKGKITVVASKTIPMKYSSTSNRLVLNSQGTTGAVDMEGLIVHECTHAACDIGKIKLTVGDSEALAFVAQCLFFYYRAEKDLKSGSVRPTFADPVLKAAWDVAMKVKEPRSIDLSRADIQPLLTAIAGHKLYKDTYSKEMDYNG